MAASLLPDRANETKAVREDTMLAISNRPFASWARSSAVAAATLAMLLAPAAVHAQADDFPNKTIRIIVPVPPGGATDILPRLVADKLSQKWGQPVVIENRPGAGGVIGAATAAKSDPDGYTLLSPPQAPLVISHHLRDNLGYDPSQFKAVTLLASLARCIVASSGTPYKTFKEFVDYAKANPGKVTYASPGIGSAPHLSMEWLQLLAGIKLVHVPFRGSLPAQNGVLAGHVDVMLDNLSNPLSAIKDGRLTLLAMTTRERDKQFPDKPTVRETYPEFVTESWFAVVAPPNTPDAIVAKLSQGMREALQMPDVRKRIESLPAELGGTTPAETDKMIKEEAERWGKVISAAGIKAK